MVLQAVRKVEAPKSMTRLVKAIARFLRMISTLELARHLRGPVNRTHELGGGCMEGPKEDKVKHGFAVYRCPGDNVVFLPIAIEPIRGTPVEAVTAAIVTEINGGS